MAWGLGEVYFLSVGLFQALLAYLIWRAGRRRTVHAAIGLVLGLSAIQTLNLLTRELSSYLIPEGPRRFIDTAILLTLAYLLTQFPRPMGGQRGARRTKRLWLGLLVTWGLASQVLIAAFSIDHAAYMQPRRVLHEGAFALIAGLFAIRFVPRWFETEPGPLRTQSLFAGVAAAATVFDIGSTWLLGLVTEPSRLLGGNIGATLHDLAAWFVLAAIVRVVYRAARSDQRDTWLLTGLVLATVGLGIHNTLSPDGGALEMAAQVFRPILFAIAMLRFELVDIPEAERRWAIPAASIALGAVGFMMLVTVFAPGSLEAEQIPPASALAAITVLGAFVWVSRPISRAVDPKRSAEDKGAILDRYRLALERGRTDGSDEDLTALRQRLGISRDEHAVLEHVLDQHLVLPASAVRGAASGDLIAGRYEVDRELGRGGHGRALLAWDRQAERSVVLKEVLRPWEDGASARREALEREIALAGELDADGLARVLDLVEEGPRVYLVREFVSGRSLRDLVEEEGPMEPDQARALIGDLAQAIEALHSAGLLHLDLKPDNIVVTDDGQPVIIDHGTVQRIETSGTDGRTATLDSTGPAPGTLAWMAPEQVLEAAVDERTDLFALGALLYYVTRGRCHVETEGRPQYEIEDAIVRGEPPRDAPDPVSQVVTACLRRPL